MIHELTEGHKRHLRETGIAEPPETIEISEEEYAEHAANWGRVQHWGDLHAKVLSHAAWKRQNRQPSAPPASAPSPEPVVTYDIRWELRIIAFILFLLFSLLLIRPAKAQFSHVNYVNWQASGSNISGAFFTYPFNINCLANLTCTVSGNTLSINAASGGTGCTLPGGSGLLLFDNVTSCADVTKWSTNGTTTITAAATAVLDLSASSLVKLRFASGATTSTNGDLAYDSLNAKWQIWQGAANKNLIAASNLGTSGQPCLSNADGSCTFADPVVSQPTASLLNAQVVGNVASAASDSGNPVKTGGVFNTTQPTVTTGQRVDAQFTARGAAIVGTGVDTFHVTVDAAPTTTVTGTVTANIGTTNGLALDATVAKLNNAQGSTTSGQTGPLAQGAVTTSAPTYTTAQTSPLSLTTAGALRTDASATTQPVSGTVTSNAGTGTFTVGQATGTNLHMVCDSGCSSSAGFADNSAFTVGTTAINPLGGYFTSGADPSLTTGNAARARIDSHSYLFTDLTAIAGTVLGAPSNYGTSPGAVEVAGVNAFITNTPTVTANAGTNLNTSLLALDTSVNGILNAQASTTSGEKGPLDQCAVTTSAPSYTTAQTDPLSCDTSGNLRVSVLNTPNVNIQSNASVNLAQVAGTTTATGNGTSGAGDARVNVASDNTAIANWGQGATGSAVPSGAVYDAGNGSGNLTGRLQCDGYAFYDASTNGATQLVALVSGKTIFVCGYSFTSSSSTANTLKLVYGTGSNCATGQTAMTPGYILQAAASTGPIGKVVSPTGHVSGLKSAASNAVCVLTNAAQPAQAEVWYTQF